MITAGTRTRQIPLNIRGDQGSDTRSQTRDLGMSKTVTASCTFVNSTTKQVQAANGTFTAFALFDQILVEGANLNNGFFTVTALDSTNHAYLVLDPSCKNEGPLTVTIRTA